MKIWTILIICKEIQMWSLTSQERAKISFLKQSLFFFHKKIESWFQIIIPKSGSHEAHTLSHDDMMKMYFYFGYENVQMIFKDWLINSPLSLFWTCLILVIVTLFHEWLRVWRDNLQTSKYNFGLLKLQNNPIQLWFQDSRYRIWAQFF